MIMRIKSSLFISLCLILLTMSITAQDKQLSLHDLIPGGKTYSRFVPRDMKQLRWCGDEYLYVKGDSVLGAKPGKKEEVLFSLAPRHWRSARRGGQPDWASARPITRRWMSLAPS